MALLTLPILLFIVMTRIEKLLLPLDIIPETFIYNPLTRDFEKLDRKNLGLIRKFAYCYYSQ
jgi:hypothetical protein